MSFADSESQLEKLAAVVDHQEADAIYVVYYISHICLLTGS
uniref:Sigma70_r2 domain-containing protein n=1 Tax=Heterorhabditis bacteriophora TaxID=37862 RepID=A0A1I7X2F3_HETBA